MGEGSVTDYGRIGHGMGRKLQLMSISLDLIIAVVNDVWEAVSVAPGGAQHLA